MPYQITNQDFDNDGIKELYLQMLRAWLLNSTNMVDSFRGDDVFDQLFYNGINIRWYRGPNGSFIWLGNLHDSQADFHLLNPNGPGIIRYVGQFHSIFREIFHDLNLKRLNLLIPSEAKTVVKGAEKLGFVKEGVLRKAALFNNKWTDVQCFGLLYEDIPKKEKKKRIRIRHRRKRPFGKAKRKSQEKKDREWQTKR